MIPFIWQYVADETWVRTILEDPGLTQGQSVGLGEKREESFRRAFSPDGYELEWLQQRWE